MADEGKIIVKLPDGTEASYEGGATGIEIAEERGFAPTVVAVYVEGKLLDLGRSLPQGSRAEFVVASSPEGTDILRHSASHIMAEAVLDLFPDGKTAIGPATDEGFYYDFDLPRPLTEDDLTLIEEKMRESMDKGSPFERMELTLSQARERFADQPFKIELLEGLDEEEVISVYNHGSFTDLCRGPHVPDTSRVVPAGLKLLSVAGAYWRGDEHRPMLQRIYGTAFDSAEGLEAYLKRREEIARRDHRRLGKDLDFFTVSPEFGAGLILWLPEGSKVRRVIEGFWSEEHLRRGYEIVYTPHLASEEIYKRSGHLEAYSEMMYAPMEIEGRPYRAKPMNCPGHLKIFQSRQRSYRDLPIRLAELGTVYRYERSGVLHGMLRVRGFTQDDAHIFCRPDQLTAEIHGVLDLASFLMKTFGYEFQAYLATRPDKYIGTDEEWEFATNCLRQALEERKLPFEIDEGGGVFYAPKIDFKVFDAMGREWQGPTCQVDLNLPARFGIEYIDAEGKAARAIMVHRTVLGSMERFVGGLLEHYGGAFPVWLAPVQARIISVSKTFEGYGQEVRDLLAAKGLRAELDDRGEKVGYKIRDGEMKKVPYLLVVGRREVENRTVSVRRRGTGDEGPMDLEAFAERVLKESEARTLG
ncbi:MAG: threonine--tRNA ligase [Planctomycetota bacterium]|jgi:threonyl-tRNA synthetase